MCSFVCSMNAFVTNNFILALHWPLLLRTHSHDETSFANVFWKTYMKPFLMTFRRPFSVVVNSIASAWPRCIADKSYDDDGCIVCIVCSFFWLIRFFKTIFQTQRDFSSRDTKRFSVLPETQRDFPSIQIFLLFFLFQLKSIFFLCVIALNLLFQFNVFSTKWKNHQTIE